jgi:hypothetical protein
MTITDPITLLPDPTMERHMLRLSVLPGSTVVECNPAVSRAALEILRPAIRDELADRLDQLG